MQPHVQAIAAPASLNPTSANLNPLRTEPGKVPLPILLRNTFFDMIFYDTKGLTGAEWRQLLTSTDWHDEGGMLVVHPGAENRQIEPFSRSFDLLEAHPETDAVIMPGVGSSIIGTASLARQVADITGRPAVGIITGYGVENMVAEALGGWFDFGTINRARSLVAAWRRQLGAMTSATAMTSMTATSDEKIKEKYKVKSTTFFVEEPESNTLLNIMLRHAPRLRLVVGHSKGALNIQNALFAFVDQTGFAPEEYRGINILTFGCGVSLPESFERVYQFVGTWDSLGRLNTPISGRDDPTLSWIDRKCHNLSSVNPLHMIIEALLPEKLIDGAGPTRRATPAAVTTIA